MKKKWKTKPRLGPRLQATHSGKEERAERRLNRAFKLVDAAVTVWEHAILNRIKDEIT